MLEIVYINEGGKVSRLACPTSFEDEKALRKALRLESGKESRVFGSLRITVNDRDLELGKMGQKQVNRYIAKG